MWKQFLSLDDKLFLHHSDLKVLSLAFQINVHFGPKLLVFSYEGMVCRYMLYIVSHSQFVMHSRYTSQHIHQTDVSRFVFQ